MDSDEWDPSVTGSGCSISIYTAKLGKHSPLQECDPILSGVQKRIFLCPVPAMGGAKASQPRVFSKDSPLLSRSKLKFPPAAPTISKDAAAKLRNLGVCWSKTSHPVRAIQFTNI